MFFTTINSLYVFVGVLLLGAAGGALGSFAVLRKQGLLGDALAHTALPGIAVAFLIMESKFLPGLLLGAFVSGLIGAALIYFLVYFSKIKMDTAMASVLSAFFGMGILLLTAIQKMPTAAQSGLESFLFGQTAGLLKEDVIWMSILFVLVGLMIILLWKELKVIVFDRAFATSIGLRAWIVDFIFMTLFVMMILLSLQAVGVILTAAVFVTPAASALMWSRRLYRVVLWAAIFGALAGAGGVYFSANVPNMPTGPVIVVVATSIFFLSFLLAPKSGIVAKLIKRQRTKFKVKMENALGWLGRSCEHVGCKEVSLKDFKERGYGRRVLAYLRVRDWVKVCGDLLVLTKAGLKEASKIIEKHRLWEAYLVHRFNLPEDHVHRDAEEMEHILTDEVVKQLKKILDNPKADPHGKPIKVNL